MGCTLLSFANRPPNLPTVTCFTSTTLQPINHCVLEKAIKTLCPADMAENCFHYTMPFKILRKVLALFSLTITFFSNWCICRPQDCLPRYTKAQVKGQQEDVKIPLNLICATLHVDLFHHFQALFVERLIYFWTVKKR